MPPIPSRGWPDRSWRGPHNERRAESVGVPTVLQHAVSEAGRTDPDRLARLGIRQELATAPLGPVEDLQQTVTAQLSPLVSGQYAGRLEVAATGDFL
jgi:hypothetical protein